MGRFARLLIAVLLGASGGDLFAQIAAPTNTLPAANVAAAAEEAYNLSLVVQKMEAHVAAKDLAALLKYNYVSMKAFQFLLSRPVLALPDKQAEIRPALLEFSRKLTAVQNAAVNHNQPRAEVAVKELREAWARVKAMYPPDLLEAMSTLSRRFFCPKHGEVIAAADGDRCAKCGRSLQRVDEFCGLPSSDPIIRAAALPTEPLRAGQKADVTLKLSRKDGAPIRETDLLATHTQRIHLFAIDPSLTDYQHAHPAPGTNAGEYTFSFTPKNGGAYRVWLDVLPFATRREEMPSLDLGEFVPAALGRDLTDVATNGAWRLKFSIDDPPLRAGFPGWARLTVTDLAGKPCTRLEPIMANFAHFVGFHEDEKTVYHLHAAGLQDILDPTARSGPEVNVYLPALKGGFTRIFVQVQIGGQVITAPFGINVAG